jgi:glycine/D-amino acid oxidase-like deaminating enzyme
MPKVVEADIAIIGGGADGLSIAAGAAQLGEAQQTVNTFMSA